jgi:predicted phage terminase large subunit-like protein
LAKPDEILSGTVADSINFWIENGLKSRRNSSEWCPIVICAQRLGTNDPPGYVLEHYPEVTVHIKVPQIADDGTNNFPETRTLEDCIRTKAANPFAYSAQLQQEPIILGGNLIHTSDFVMEEISAAIRWDSKIITADTALEAGQENDNSVLQCWGRLGMHAYLIDEAAGKWESPELLAMALAFHKKHHQPSDNADRVNSPVNRFTVEKKASGHGLIQQLQRLGIPAEGIERTKDKVTRVQEILPYIATHMVHVARNAPWTSAFLTECAAFRADGKAPHDDRVDTLCDGVWILLGKPISILDSMTMSRKRFG